MAILRLRQIVAVLLIQAIALPVMAEGLSGSYLAGRQARYLNDFDAVARYYTRAVTRDPGNPVLLETAAMALLSLGEIDRAVPIARKLAADGTNSQVGNIVLVADEGVRGAFDEILQRGDDKGGVGPLVDGLMLGWAHMGKGDMTAALNEFAEVAKERGLTGFANYHKALALASVGDFEGAEAIYAAQEAGPMQMTRRGAVAHIEVLSQLERGGDAIALMDTLFGTDLDPGLREMRAALEAGKALPFSVVRDAREGLAEVFYSVGAALSNEAEDDYTLLYVRAAEYLRPDHEDAILLSAQLLDQLDRFELAVTTYGRVPRDSYAFHAAELGRAEALRRSGKTDAAVEVLSQLSQTHGDIALVHVTMGDLMRQLDRNAEAVAAYDRALALHPEEDPAQWFIYYARGICYGQLDKWPESEGDFRTALRLNPEQPQVLNYLGYSLVEKQEKLDEALGMIERAVAAQPDSGYIVDSLGWVLYRLGRYGEAIGHMERAAELMPVDPIVNDHLGDVLWSVGRRLEAEFHWKRALSFIDGGESAEDADPDRIRRKLEVGLDQVLSDEGAPPLKLVNGEN